MIHYTISLRTKMSRFDPEIHHRKTIRYEGYDYSSAGVYFVTICCFGFKNRFGTIRNGIICLNSIGSIVFNTWIDLKKKYTLISIDEFQIMPNHFHGMLEISLESEESSLEITRIIGEFKSVVYYKSLRLYKSYNKEMGKLWQRNFYEHIIRDYSDLTNCRAYIRNNPMNWTIDHLYR